MGSGSGVTIDIETTEPPTDLATELFLNDDGSGQLVSIAAVKDDVVTELLVPSAGAAVADELAVPDLTRAAVIDTPVGAGLHTLRFQRVTIPKTGTLHDLSRSRPGPRPTPPGSSAATRS